MQGGKRKLTLDISRAATAGGGTATTRPPAAPAAPVAPAALGGGRHDRFSPSGPAGWATRHCRNGTMAPRASCTVGCWIAMLECIQAIVCL